MEYKINFMRKLNLDTLKQGQTGITPNVAAFLVEAAIYCLAENGHQPGVTLNIEGDFTESFKIYWTEEVTEQMRRAWKDTKEVTEYGATAIAALLVSALLDCEILSRTEQDEGVDYQIGNKNSIELNAQLEVSGIWSRTPQNTINIRVYRKLKKEENRKDKVPVYIIVTEFSQPKSKIIKYDGSNQTNT